MNEQSVRGEFEDSPILTSMPMGADHMADRLLCTTTEAAELLGISRTHVYRLMKANELRSVKIGARRLIPRSVLVEYVDDLLLAS